MSQTWAVARRELLSLWVTPLAWLLLCAFSLMNGAAFIATLTSLEAVDSGPIDGGPLQAFYGQSIFVPLGYLLLCPLLSMRTLAEERHSGTSELLLASPLTATNIVVGKYLALALTYLAMWLPTVAYPFILRDTGYVEWAVVGSSYLGVVGLGLGFIAVGLLASGITDNQLVAALLTGTFIFLLLLCGLGEHTFQDGPLHDLFSHVSVQSHLSECSLGVLSLRRLVYLVTLIALPQFLCVRAVERWRGD